MPAVKNTSGTLGHSVCRLLDVDFKIMSQSGGLYYFVFFIFCTNAFLVIYSLYFVQLYCFKDESIVRVTFIMTASIQ